VRLTNEGESEPAVSWVDLNNNSLCVIQEGRPTVTDQSGAILKFGVVDGLPE